MSERKHTLQLQLKAREVMGRILERPSLLEKTQRRELIEEIRDRYNYKSRQAYRLYNLAVDMLIDVMSREADKNLNRALIDREYLLQKAKEEGDMRLLLEVMKDRDKLLGLYVDRSRTDVSIRAIDMANFTDYGLERIAKGEEVTVVMQDPASYRLVVGTVINA